MVFTLIDSSFFIIILIVLAGVTLSFFSDGEDGGVSFGFWMLECFLSSSIFVSSFEILSCRTPA